MVYFNNVVYSGFAKHTTFFRKHKYCPRTKLCFFLRSFCPFKQSYWTYKHISILSSILYILFSYFRDKHALFTSCIASEPTPYSPLHNHLYHFSLYIHLFYSRRKYTSHSREVTKRERELI